MVYSFVRKEEYMEWADMQAMKRFGAVLCISGGAAVAVKEIELMYVQPLVPVGLVVAGLAVAALGAAIQFLHLRSIHSVPAAALHNMVKRE